MSKGLAAVTGGAGFLGRPLVAALMADGWRVRALLRRDPIHPAWRGLVPEVVVGALEDDAALDRLCAGADVVVHAAGLTAARDRSAFDAVNVAGARRVARRAPARMLLVSSLAAREPRLSGYAASKRGGEDAAREILGGRLTVARPPALYGPLDPATLPLFQAAARSPALPVFDAAARLTLMHVHDAARQLVALAATPTAATATLCDSRPQGYAWREILETAAREVGARPAIVPAPAWLLKAAALAATMFSAGRPAIFGLGKAREMLHADWSVRLDEQVRGLPEARFTLESGFRDAVAGYREAGLLK